MKKENREQPKGGFFKLMAFLTSSIAWLQIVASPFIIGSVIGIIIYIIHPSTTRLIIGVSTSVLGLILGVIWANKKWKDRGAVQFISRVIATSELDNQEEEKSVQ